MMKGMDSRTSTKWGFNPLWGVLAGLALAVLLVAMASAMFGTTVKEIIQMIDDDQRVLYLERERAVQPYRIALDRAKLAVGLGLQILIVGGFIFAGGVGLRALAVKVNVWSRQVRARDGLYPVMLGDDGRFLDVNRQPGPALAVTLAALQVQKQAALRADKLGVNLRVEGGPPVEALASPPIPWPARVPLASLLDDPVSLHNITLGVTYNAQGGQEIVQGDMLNMVHMAVGGSSGWGKSVFLRALVHQFVKAVEEPWLCLVDLEGVTLNDFADSDRLLYPLVDDERSAVALLGELNAEMDKRKALFNAVGADSLGRYNAKSSRERLPSLIAVIDEATALLGNKEVEGSLRDLVLRARKYGLWFVLAGQDWKSSSLDTAIRNQIATRVQFKALSASQSRVLLDQAGAEEFAQPGLALAALPGRGVITMLAPYVGGGTRIEGSGPKKKLVRPETDEEKVLRLSEAGMSRRQIEMAVRGYCGGAATAFVEKVLAEVNGG